MNALGSWAAAIAVWGYATYQFRAGPAGVAALTAAAASPALLFGAHVGVAVDRLTPRRALVLAYSVSAGLAAAMVLCRSLTELASVAFLLGIFSTTGRAAAAALPPTVMDHDQLSRANALMGTSNSAGQVLGPLAAGATIAAFGFHAAFLFDALTYLVGVACLVPIHGGPRAGHRSPVSWREDFSAGIAVARSVTAVRRLLIVSGVLTMTSGAFVVFEPLYTRRVLGRPPSQFALFEAAAGVGALVCGFVLASTRRRWVTPRRVMAVAIADGCACALFLGTRSVAAAYAGAVFWGVAGTLFAVGSTTLLQEACATEFHGRLFGTRANVDGVGDNLGYLLAGSLGSVVGIRRAALSSAALPIGAAIIALVGLASGGPRRRTRVPPSRTRAPTSKSRITGNG